MSAQRIKHVEDALKVLFIYSCSYVFSQYTIHCTISLLNKAFLYGYFVAKIRNNRYSVGLTTEPADLASVTSFFSDQGLLHTIYTLISLRKSHERRATQLSTIFALSKVTGYLCYVLTTTRKSFYNF